MPHEHRAQDRRRRGRADRHPPRHPCPSRARLRGGAHRRHRGREAQGMGLSRSPPASARPASSAPSGSATIRARSACAPTWTRCRWTSTTPSTIAASTRAACMPAAMTATPPCCWAPRKYLSATRNFDGTVHFIFQPAEEGRGGAEAMVKDGLFEKFPVRADLRHAQQAQARCRQVRHPLGPADGRRRPVRHPHHRQGRARRAAGDRHRSGDHRHPDHLGAAERGVAQRGAARFGGDLGHPDACRRRLQRDPAGGGAARHHPRLPQGDDGADQGAHRDDLRGHRHRRWAAAPRPTCASPSRRWSTTGTR